MRVFWRILLAGLALAATAVTAHGATIPVTTTADVVANDGLCSLREAVSAARLNSPVLGCPAGSGPPAEEDVIQLEAAEYRLAAGGANEQNNETGDLDTGPFNVVRILGRGMGLTVIGGAGDRIFDVFDGATLGLADLTVRDGVAPSGGSGGAVRSRGVLTAVRTAWVNNATADAAPSTDKNTPPGEAGGGGAIWSSGQMQIADSVFSGNSAGDGADAAFYTGTVINTIFNGTSGGSGGAILVEDGTASLVNVTVSGSRAGSGGANPTGFVVVDGGSGGRGGAVAVTGGSLSVQNGTFQGNRSGNSPPPGSFFVTPGGAGGAIAATAPASLTISFSTFSGNATGTASDGTPGAGGSVSGGTVSASILADGGGACATAAPASLANLVLAGDNTCAGARVVGDPRLGPLGDNGGSIPTMAPGAGSPAIDALVGVPCPATDARGLARPAFAGCDVGAVEVQPGAPGAPGGPGAGGAGILAPRTLTGLKVAPAAFRTTGRKPLGTRVRFRLNTAGRVVVTVRRAAAGKRSKARCVAPTRRLRTARPCTRQVTLRGKLTRQGAAGLNAFRFSGTLRGRALAPGRYTLVVTLPRLGASAPVVATRRFRVLP